ncbi:MAG: amidophosphoribosyltransferase [Lysobacterales bacterium RIFOXYA1_FULL_69_10]|nr:MAG: amidophosphoribosyltransferase [Xanthomonadales bacterium RIFOXYA1_FULL_69_10]
MPDAVNLRHPFPVDGLGARLARRIWRPRCLLCGEAGHFGLDLCAACAAALPWNRSACVRCGLPLPGAADALDDGGRDGTSASGSTVADTEAFTCGACLRRPPPQTQCIAAFRYAPPLDRLMPRLKFHADLAAGRLLSRLMASCLAGTDRPDALVPLPLHRSRLRERGYDQALELARPLARDLALPLRSDLLQRVRATPPQSRLDAAQRRRNVRGAFRVDDTGHIPAHVALLDDVMTTGATVHAAVRALQRAGVQRVDVWVCARVP